MHLWPRASGGSNFSQKTPTHFQKPDASVAVCLRRFEFLTKNDHPLKARCACGCARIMSCVLHPEKWLHLNQLLTFVSASSSRSYLLETFVDLTSPLRSVLLREFETIQPGSPYASNAHGVSKWETHGTECGARRRGGLLLRKLLGRDGPAVVALRNESGVGSRSGSAGARRRSKALAAGAGSENSLIDGTPHTAAGLRAVATLVAGLSAGFLMAPVSSTEASAPDSAAGMSFLRGVNLDMARPRPLSAT